MCWVPIRVGPDADQVLAFVKSVVARVASAHPRELTVEHSISARRGRVYLDPFRNGFWPDGGRTLFGPAPREGAYFHTLGTGRR